MKAVLLEKPEQMRLVDFPDETPGPGEVVLRVEACSICGSDLEGYHGIHPKVTLPRVMGHEVACHVEIREEYANKRNAILSILRKKMLKDTIFHIPLWR